MNRRELLMGGVAGLAAWCGGACARNATGAFLPAGLERIRTGLRRYIDAGFAPGLVAAVARRDDVERIAVGKTAVSGGTDMRRDAIFRIASMTKPMTAAAVLMLIDDGRLRHDEPVGRLLPELDNRRVLRTIDAALDDTVPAKRSLTVEDLLTCRCGLGMIVGPPDQYPIQKAIATLGVNGVGFGPPDPAMPLDGDAWLRQVATLPLFAQPGEQWFYTAGSNIQGVLVARATGAPLSRFLEERLWGPLGMKDTAFVVRSGSRDRLVPAYRVQDNALVLSDDPTTGKWTRPPAFEQGDAGLVSTVDDYLSFARMLLARGQHEGRSLLSPASAQAMTTNHLTPGQQAGGREILGGRGWGYGLSVVTDARPGQPSPGAFGWNGGFGTSWISDPAKDLTMILLTQHEFASASGDPIHAEFQRNAYAALQ